MSTILQIDQIVLGFFTPGPTELIIFGAIAVLIFGNRLPSVARSLGKSFIEFKKGVRGIEDEVTDVVHSEPSQVTQAKSQEPASPSFTPPTEPPKQHGAT